MQCVRESNSVENLGNICTGVNTEHFRILMPHRGDSGARSTSGQELTILHLSFPITKPRGLSLLHWYSKFCPTISKRLQLTCSDEWTEVPKMKSALHHDLSREEQGLPGFVFPLYTC